MATQHAPDFPARLRQLRKRRELSQAVLAEGAGVHFTQISRYERGETTPGADAAAALARELETTVDYLMAGTTDDAAATAGLERELVARLREGCRTSPPTRSVPCSRYLTPSWPRVRSRDYWQAKDYT